MSGVGKLLPSAIELEEAVLGALLLEGGAIDQIEKMVKAEMFYKDEHKEIYHAIYIMNKQNIPIDLLTTTNFLRTLGKLEFAGGAFYLSELTNRVSSAANLMYHSMIVMQKYMLRQIINISFEAQKEAYDDTSDVFDILDSTMKNLEAVRDFKMDKPEQKLVEVVQEIKQEVTTKDNQIEVLNGISTGFREFDSKIGLLLNGSLIIIAARPGNGKSSWLMAILYNVAKYHKIPVAIFSYEMTNIQVAARILAKELNVSAGDILRKNLLKSKIDEIDIHITAFNDVPLYMEDNQDDDILRLVKKIKMIVKKYGCKAVGVDYIQIIPQIVNDKKNQMSNRDLEVGAITRALKRTAKELGIPIIALSQLSRKLEERRDKRPILSDLRESGQIEGDADMVQFLYRPELYDIKEEIIYGEKVNTENLVENIIGKNRFGAHSIFIPLRWHGPTTSFSDWSNSGDLFQPNIDDSGDLPF
jgi:replicative DNA helicase